MNTHTLTTNFINSLSFVKSKTKIFYLGGMLQLEEVKLFLYKKIQDLIFSSNNRIPARAKITLHKNVYANLDNKDNEHT